MNASDCSTYSGVSRSSVGIFHEILKTLQLNCDFAVVAVVSRTVVMWYGSVTRYDIRSCVSRVDISIGTVAGHDCLLYGESVHV